MRGAGRGGEGQGRGPRLSHPLLWVRCHSGQLSFTSPGCWGRAGRGSTGHSLAQGLCTVLILLWGTPGPSGAMVKALLTQGSRCSSVVRTGALVGVSLTSQARQPPSGGERLLSSGVCWFWMLQEVSALCLRKGAGVFLA